MDGIAPDERVDFYDFVSGLASYNGVFDAALAGAVDSIANHGNCCILGSSNLEHAGVLFADRPMDPDLRVDAQTRHLSITLDSEGYVAGNSHAQLAVFIQ